MSAPPATYIYKRFILTDTRKKNDTTMLHLPQYIKCAKTLKVGQTFNTYTEAKGPDLGLGSVKSEHKSGQKLGQSFNSHPAVKTEQKSGYVLDYRLIRTPEDFKDFFRLHTVLFLKVRQRRIQDFRCKMGISTLYSKIP